MSKVCAIVVTFNRKMLLAECLKALLKQTHALSAIYIVDNAATDQTFEYLQEQSLIIDVRELQNGFYYSSMNDVDIYYLKLDYNSGGAGGFNSGLKGARELDKFDYFWMMDDDGYPSPTCLEKLMPYIDEHNYVMPVSIDIENFEKLSWPVRKKNGRFTRSYLDIKISWGEIIDYIFPFNGSLLSKQIVDDVGYPKKELFIWGDEYEHYWRCRNQSYNPVTIVDAEFYHPANKLDFKSIWFGLYKVPYTDQDWRFICLVRNSTYIYWNYTGKHIIIFKFLAYSSLLLFKECDWKRYKLYINSILDGINGEFTRHFKYMK